MKGNQIRFVDRLQATLEPFDPDDQLASGQVLIRTLFSVVSAGTEGSHFSGLEDQHPGSGKLIYPRSTGYGNYGEIIGSDSNNYAVGDRVLTFANHASHVKVQTGSGGSGGFCLKVPKEIPGEKAVFTRMIGVAISAIRASSVSVGDKVLVIGLGLVGNFAAQLFRIAGADVMATDLSDFRRAKAEQCGVTNTINPSKTDLRQAVINWTNGEGVQICVEAIGKSELISEGVQLTRRLGEVILLGSPRALVTMEITQMLSRIHLKGIKMIGALEWLVPLRSSDLARHTIEQNYNQIVNLIKTDQIIVEPLRTHLISPENCQDGYFGLHDRKESYLGVVFDWSKLEN